MPDFILFTWVKNVNKQRIDSVVKGGILSPVYNICIQVTAWVVGKVFFTQPTFHTQPIWFSTLVSKFLYLLNSCYTHNPQGLLLRLHYRN